MIKIGIIEEEETIIYQYGFQVGLEILCCYIVSALIVIYMNKIWEYLFFLIIFIPIRMYAGGLHLKKYWTCFVGSILVQIGVLTSVHYLDFSDEFLLLLIFLLGLIIVMLGPVESNERKIEMIEMAKFCKCLFCIIIFWEGISILLYIFSKTYILSLVTVTLLLIVFSMLLGICRGKFACTKERREL